MGRILARRAKAVTSGGVGIGGYNAVMARRCVILHHTGHGPEHYDWMVEDGEALATWQTAEGPDELAVGETIGATRLPDHRLAYLDYEGPVSGNRGSVRRVFGGTCELTERTEARWVVRLPDERGTILLQRGEDDLDAWTLHRVE